MKISFTVCRTLLRNNHRINHRNNLRTLPPFSHSLSSATSAALPRRFFHASPQNILPNFPHYSSKRFFCEASAEKPLETAAETATEESSGEVVERKCWNCDSCQTTESFIFCYSCGCIQPADESITYFKLFDLEQRFAIDESDLEAKYKDWQKKLQPDQFQSKSEKEKGYAAEQSDRLKEAFRMLNDPLSRALYIIKLHGFPPASERSDDDDLELSPENLRIKKAGEDALAAGDEEVERIRRLVLLKLRPQDVLAEDAAKKEDAAKEA